MIKRKTLLRFVLAIQLAILGLLGLNTLGFGIPILRQVIGFVYLSFIPGLLILYILKLRRMGCVETLLYSVGLSIAFVMFIGFFMNMVYPLFGNYRPISVLPVTVTITFAVLILYTIAYKQESVEEDSQLNALLYYTKLRFPPGIFILSLPFLAILGTHMAYVHQNNVLLLILLALIALIIVLVTFDKFITTDLYPIALVAIALSLLWYWSLISPSLHGMDIHHEYWIQNQVISNSLWQYSGGVSNVNAMLSVVMLAPIYSLVLNLNSVWVFKIIYPIFFSLVPVALFQAYKKQTDLKIAFLAAFFFMSFPVFFSELTGQIRQPTAELFFALSILLLLEKEMQALKRATLLIIFGFAIVVSHYGLSYFYMFYLSMGIILLFFWKNATITGFEQALVTRFKKSRQCGDIIALQRNTLTVTYVTLFIVFCLTWYLYVSSGHVFCSLIRIGNHIHNSLYTELFSPDAIDPFVIQALGLKPMRSVDVEWRIARYIQYITQLFIVVGVLNFITHWRKKSVHIEYTVMVLISMVLIAMSIIIPHFAMQLNMTRIYHITLFFLAPFCILGGITTFHWLRRIVSSLLAHREVVTPPNINLKLVAILVLLPYFLFTTGFVFAVTGATPCSMPLSLYEVDWSFFTGSEVSARSWIIDFSQNESKVYSEGYGGTQLNQEIPRRTIGWSGDVERLRKDSYVFLRRWNIAQEDVHWFSITSSKLDKIYDSGNAKIFGPSKGVYR